MPIIRMTPELLEAHQEFETLMTDVRSSIFGLGRTSLTLVCRMADAVKNHETSMEGVDTMIISNNMAEYFVEHQESINPVRMAFQQYVSAADAERMIGPAKTAQYIIRATLDEVR